MQNKRIPFSWGFTLAEVLITLGIIGVVAALTIPALIQKYQEKVTVTKLKRAYSILNQAYQNAINEYGPLEYWGFTEDATVSRDPETGEEKYNDSAYSNAKLFWNNMSKFLKVTETCIASECLSGITHIKTLAGKEKTANFINIIKINDGTTILGSWLTPNHSRCSTNGGYSYCGDFAVVTSTPKNSHFQIGKDVFYFKITKSGIAPFGLYNELDRRFPSTCNLTSTADWNGYGCTAWVLHNENMDYLHCSDLGWDGKLSCK